MRTEYCGKYTLHQLAPTMGPVVPTLLFYFYFIPYIKYFVNTFFTKFRGKFI